MNPFSESIADLETKLLIQLVLSAVVFVIFVMFQWLTRKNIRRLSQKFAYTPNRTAATKRLLIIFIYVFTAVVLIIIWGGDLKNIWVSLGSILGVIAIGFFAIWSILSNIVAGLIIYTINPFEITDTLTLVEKDITGKVVDIGLIYTTLEDSDGILTVPNNLFFQQVIKVKK